MKKEDLYKAVTDIPDSYIQESEAYQQKRRIPRSFWLLPLAAAIAIVLLLPKNTASPVASPLILAEAQMPEPMTDAETPEQFIYSDDYGTWRNDFHQKSTASRNVNAPLYSFYEKAVPLLLGSSDDNRIVSPLNIWMALAMLEETTANDTQKEILQVLGIDHTEQLRTAANAIWNACYADTPTLQCKALNSMWLNGSHTFRTEPLQVLADTYKASSYAGDPSDPAYTSMFQDWLNTATGGLLKDAVSQEKFTPDMVLTLASALYYKASWAMRFDPALTDTLPFHTPEGTIETTFLHNTFDYPLYTGDIWTAVSLPLAEGGAMYIYLPDEGHTPEEVLQDPAFYEILRDPSLHQSNSADEVNLSLPVFDISCTLDLCDILPELGIQRVFTNEADFSPLTDETIFVSDANHPARLLIDEEGVTGAAYTDITKAGGYFIPGQTVDFTVDRPFAFAVVHADSSLLFSGIVTHPGK